MRDRFLKWGLSGLLALFILLTTALRHNYIWIIGDDPNLMAQAILVSKGFLPNLDFFSGYPGLSIQIQSQFVQWFGPTPIAQHLWTAATQIGLILVFFSSVHAHPLLTFFSLVLIFSQGYLLNPSPNPGYAFAVFFILGLKKNSDFLQNQNMRHAVLAGIFFGISFLFKQYGVFGPLTFALSSLTLLVSSARRKLFVGLNVLISVLVAVLYILVLVPAEQGRSEVMLNAAVFLLPALASFRLRAAATHNGGLSTLQWISVNFAMAVVFAGAIIYYFFSFYGADKIVEVVRTIFFDAPRTINQHLLAVNFSEHSLYQTGLALVAVLGLWRLHAKFNFSEKWFIASVFVLLAGLLIPKMDNLSNTPFLGLAPLFLFLLASATKIDGVHSVQLLAIGPFFVLLVPYPNIAYHLPIFLYLALQVLEPPQQVARASSPLLGLIVAAVALVILSPLCYRVHSQMKSTTAYEFRGLSFISGDPHWPEVIAETESLGRSGKCQTQGCRYLLVATSKDWTLEQIQP